MLTFKGDRLLSATKHRWRHRNQPPLLHLHTKRAAGKKRGVRHPSAKLGAAGWLTSIYPSPSRPAHAAHSTQRHQPQGNGQSGWTQTSPDESDSSLSLTCRRQRVPTPGRPKPAFACVSWGGCCTEPKKKSPMDGSDTPVFSLSSYLTRPARTRTYNNLVGVRVQAALCRGEKGRAQSEVYEENQRPFERFQRQTNTNRRGEERVTSEAARRKRAAVIHAQNLWGEGAHRSSPASEYTNR